MDDVVRPGVTALEQPAPRAVRPPADRDPVATWFITRATRGAPPPVSRGNDVTPFVEYADYYEQLGAALGSLGEGATVLVAGWGLDLETPLGGTALTIGAALKQAGARHARVRVMLSGHLGNPSPPMVAWLDVQPGCAAVLDDRVRLPGCFHQKSVVIAGSETTLAFVGGMDISRDRLAGEGRAPWHDVQVAVRGQAASDLYATLAARWECHPRARGERLPKPGLRTGTSPGRAVQVVRTYGNPRTGVPLTTLRPSNSVLSIARTLRQLTAPSEFAFAPTGESSIHDLLVQAIRATRESIYVEDQYFIASMAMGGAEELLQALADTIARPTFKHMLVLTAGIGTVQGELHQVNRRRRDLFRRITGSRPDRVSVWAYKAGNPRVSWLHSKAWMFDDTMAVIGSANFNRRGLSHDGELGVGVLDLEDPAGGWVHALRTKLWVKHLTEPGRTVTAAQVADPEIGRALWKDTKHSLVAVEDLEKGNIYAPDTLAFCDDPMPPEAMQRFLRRCACDVQVLGRRGRSPDNQWNFGLDPDGT